MTHGFRNALRKLYFTAITNPRFTLMTTFYVAQMLAWMITGLNIWFWAAIGWCLFWLIYEKLISHGFFINHVTPMFYVYSFFDTGYIYQLKRKGKRPCGRDTARYPVREKASAFYAPGRTVYSAYAHNSFKAAPRLR